MSILLFAAAAAVTEPVPESGLFERGISFELPSVGVLVVNAPGMTRVGPSVAAAMQFDLGPRWALRFPIDVGLAPGGLNGFVTAAITPGVLYRFRSSADDRWVPYAGLGVRLGAIGVGRELLGAALLPDPALTAAPLSTGPAPRPRDLDDGDGDGRSEYERINTENRATAAPELWFGTEWHPNRWFSMNFGATYFYWRVLGAGVHTATARVGVRFSF